MESLTYCLVLRILSEVHSVYSREREVVASVKVTPCLRSLYERLCSQMSMLALTPSSHQAVSIVATQASRPPPYTNIHYYYYHKHDPKRALAAVPYGAV